MANCILVRGIYNPWSFTSFFSFVAAWGLFLRHSCFCSLQDLASFCTFLRWQLVAPSVFPCWEFVNVLLGIYLLNRGPEQVDSNEKILQCELKDYAFRKEKWFFINGVMVGTFWLESAINEISRLFERKVSGIRNLTFSLLESTILIVDGECCLIWSSVLFNVTWGIRRKTCGWHITL
jgi:hypothetical protein